MSDKLNLNNLDHPCKETCSGWRQGFEKGAESQAERIKKLEAVADAARKVTEECIFTEFGGSAQDVYMEMEAALDAMGETK